MFVLEAWRARGRKDEDVGFYVQIDVEKKMQMRVGFWGEGLRAASLGKGGFGLV